jgi:hypothetical protein
MNNPDWYSEWRDDAVQELQEKNAQLGARFRIGDWPRYDYDLDAGTLIFSDHGAAKVIAEIQIAGTTSTKAGDWRWAWANAHLPSDLLKDALLARAYGEEQGIGDLTHETVRGDDLDALGWELTGVTVRIADALGAYRPPRDDGGGIFLIYRSMRWIS